VRATCLEDAKLPFSISTKWVGEKTARQEVDDDGQGRADEGERRREGGAAVPRPSLYTGEKTFFILHNEPWATERGERERDLVAIPERRFPLLPDPSGVGEAVGGGLRGQGEKA